MGLIPDRIILMKQSEKQSQINLREQLYAKNSNLKEGELNEIISKKLLEYKINVQKVKEVFKNNIFELETMDKDWPAIELQLRK